ncbi:MAG: hypothetical protein D6743_04190 [Calditrichaeota bacterium]|nr:MAG: hypothetical protein D6743_04190 [Calditrichota bacterium]
MITPHVRGVQGNLVYRLADRRALQWDVSLVVGSAVIDYDSRQTWSYTGVTTGLNLHGLFLEVGMSWGQGNFSNPQVIGQVGFVFRFRR